MKIIKGFENEDIIVSDFGEWVGKDYIDYKAEYKNNQKIIKRLLDENKQLKDNWNKLKEFIQKDYNIFDKLIAPEYGCAMGTLNRVKDKMQELEGSDNE